MRNISCEGRGAHMYTKTSIVLNEKSYNSPLESAANAKHSASSILDKTITIVVIVAD